MVGMILQKEYIHHTWYIHTGWPKKLAHFVLYALTSSNMSIFCRLWGLLLK